MSKTLEQLHRENELAQDTLNLAVSHFVECRRAKEPRDVRRRAFHTLAECYDKRAASVAAVNARKRLE